MATPHLTPLERAEARLVAIRTEQARQSEFAGVRFGVFARLRELEREERRVLRRIEELREKQEGAAR
jgi:hypothetical protein